MAVIQNGVLNSDPELVKGFRSWKKWKQSTDTYLFIDVTIKGEALDPRVCTVEGVVVTYVTALLIFNLSRKNFLKLSEICDKLTPVSFAVYF